MRCPPRLSAISNKEDHSDTEFDLNFKTPDRFLLEQVLNEFSLQSRDDCEVIRLIQVTSSSNREPDLLKWLHSKSERFLIVVSFLGNVLSTQVFSVANKNLFSVAVNLIVGIPVCYWTP